MQLTDWLIDWISRQLVKIEWVLNRCKLYKIETLTTILF